MVIWYDYDIIMGRSMFNWPVNITKDIVKLESFNVQKKEGNPIERY